MVTATLADLLERAAVRAETAPTCAKAITGAWATLHTEGVQMMTAGFAAWCRAEDFGSHASGLGGVLRRRYKTAGEVAESLRRAAAL